MGVILRGIFLGKKEGKELLLTEVHFRPHSKVSF
jgi:hypothetical protein